VGLDHASFMVDSRTDLAAEQEALQHAGIEHGEVKDLPSAGLAIPSFTDSDGVHLELTAPLS
jgi:glyoxylase I family protein